MNETYQVVHRIDPMTLEQNPRYMDYVKDDVRRKIVEQVAETLSDGQHHVVRLIVERRNGMPMRPWEPAGIEIVGRIEFGTVQYREVQMWKPDQSPPIWRSPNVREHSTKTMLREIGRRVRAAYRRFGEWCHSPVDAYSPKADYRAMVKWMNTKAKRAEAWIERLPPSIPGVAE